MSFQGRFSRTAACLVALAGLLAAGLARAQTPSPLNEWQYSAGVVLKERFDPDPPKWEKLIGFGGEMLPRFEGASNYYFEPGPTIDIRYRNIAFFSTGEGLGVNLLHSKDYRVGTALVYDMGRSEGTYYRLRGRNDLSAAPALKVFGEYVLFPVIVRADVRYNVGGVGGWIGDAGMYLPIAGNDHFFVFAGGSVTLADQNYMSHAFGVDEVEADQMILDIGPKTRAKLLGLLKNCGTIVWNGPVGVFEYDSFAGGTKALAEAIAASPAFSLAGGGDTLAAIDKFHVADKISYISTGGGAFLEFLEGKTLPAVAALEARAAK